MLIGQMINKNTKKALQNLGSKKPKKKYNNRSKKHKTKHKISEPLSERDIKELMGMNRDRYERRGGAIRRR